jgi:ABC-type transport system involved in cytochrome c biogenesis permease subunit
MKLANRLIAAALVVGSWTMPAAADGPAIDTWRRLPMLDDGRVKPLDSVARAQIRVITGREHVKLEAPASGGSASPATKHEPVELFLQLMLSWSGWDKEPGGSWAWDDFPAEYWRAHQPDAWDHTELLFIQGEELIRRLNLPKEQTRVSPAFVANAKIQLDGGAVDFLKWTNSLEGKKPSGALEEKAHDLWGRYMQFVVLRMGGTRFGVVPNIFGQSTDDPWIPLPILIKGSDEMLAAQLGENFPVKDIDVIRQRFAAARQALAKGIGSPEFTAATTEFSSALRKLGESVNRQRAQARAGTRLEKRRDLGAYPMGDFEREVFYNGFQPFQKSALIYLVATTVLGLSFVVQRRWFYWSGFAAGTAATLLAGWGMLQRSLIAGTGMESGWRSPVANLYETVIWVGLVVGVLGLMFEAIYRQRFFGLASVLVAAFSMFLADMMPADTGRGMPQLEPVLRTNYYLLIHVLTIVSSYGAGALAWGISLLALGVYIVHRPNAEAHKLTRTLATSIYRAVQVAVFLLAAGTILGGVWAYDSWGRFWGWDPKEIWALISLLCYLIVLHGRFAGSWNTFGLAAGSNLCFLSILMSWYGVNFVLPLFNEGKAVGLHGYALGQGGLGYMALGTGLDLAYLALATCVYYARWREEPERAMTAELAPTSA